MADMKKVLGSKFDTSEGFDVGNLSWFAGFKKQFEETVRSKIATTNVLLNMYEKRFFEGGMKYKKKNKVETTNSTILFEKSKKSKSLRRGNK